MISERLLSTSDSSSAVSKPSDDEKYEEQYQGDNDAVLDNLSGLVRVLVVGARQ